MRQLDCLWEGMERLKTEAGLPDAEEAPAPDDPGDLSVYFENGLTGGTDGNP